MSESAILNQVNPFLIGKKETVRLLGSVSIFRRVAHHKWIVPVMGGEFGGMGKTLFSFENVRQAAERIIGGEKPPLLPFEQLRQASKKKKSKTK